MIECTQVGGIIAGQLGLGYLADRIGRKWGSVVTAATMLVGGVLLACSNGPTVRAMFLVRSGSCAWKSQQLSVGLRKLLTLAGLAQLRSLVVFLPY